MKRDHVCTVYICNNKTTIEIKNISIVQIEQTDPKYMIIIKTFHSLIGGLDTVLCI